MPKCGDILLIQYKYDWLGWAIQAFTKSKWNHVALIIDNKNLFDCLSNGNKIKPIKKYLKCLYEIKLIRFLTLTSYGKILLFEEINKLTLLKKPGDILFIISLIQVGLRNQPLVNVCSGTVGYLFHKIGINLIKEIPYYLISPKDLSEMEEAKDVTNELFDNNSNL